MTNPLLLNGKMVTAERPLWDEAQANDKLENPDPTLPSYEGLPKEITGTLEIGNVAAQSATRSDGKEIGIPARVAYSVGGVEVDPASIKEIE